MFLFLRSLYKKRMSLLNCRCCDSTNVNKIKNQTDENTTVEMSGRDSKFFFINPLKE